MCVCDREREKGGYKTERRASRTLSEKELTLTIAATSPHFISFFLVEHWWVLFSLKKCIRDHLRKSKIPTFSGQREGGRVSACMFVLVYWVSFGSLSFLWIFSC